MHSRITQCPLNGVKERKKSINTPYNLSAVLGTSHVASLLCQFSGSLRNSEVRRVRFTLRASHNICDSSKKTATRVVFANRLLVFESLKNRCVIDIIGRYVNTRRFLRKPTALGAAPKCTRCACAPTAVTRVTRREYRTRYRTDKRAAILRRRYYDLEERVARRFVGLSFTMILLSN